MMLPKAIAIALALTAAFLLFPRPARAQLPGSKDYLTQEEAEKIRDADTPSEKIHLLLTFADDRLKKFEYELNHGAQDIHREDLLNGLLNDYQSCLDDAADLMDFEIQKQADVHKAVEEMQHRTKDFLARLQAIQKNAKEISMYKDTLDDALEGTQDAKNDADSAEKQPTAAPVRRRPQ